MKVFIDFDDVLFNTKEFKKDLLAIFYQQGISKEAIYKSMYWDGTYSLNKQIMFLEKRYKLDGKKTKMQLANFFQNLDRYVFGDVYKFLDRIGKEKLFIISYGEDKWQRYKINKAGLDKYFAGIFIGKDKSRGILQFQSSNKNKKIIEERYFIDDRVDYIKDIKKKFPGIITILLKRKERRYFDKKNKWCDKKITTLDEFLNTIKA